MLFGGTDGAVGGMDGAVGGMDGAMAGLAALAGGAPAVPPPPHGVGGPSCWVQGSGVPIPHVDICPVDPAPAVPAHRAGGPGCPHAPELCDHESLAQGCWLSPQVTQCVTAQNPV